jgi:hypothetical protein
MILFVPGRPSRHRTTAAGAETWAGFADQRESRYAMSLAEPPSPLDLTRPRPLSRPTDTPRKAPTVV